MTAYLMAEVFAPAGPWRGPNWPRGARRAREVWEGTVAYASDLGLLSEEIDPASGELGSMPRALSYLALLMAARPARKRSVTSGTSSQVREMAPAISNAGPGETSERRPAA